jgi:hypothetical protein
MIHKLCTSCNDQTHTLSLSFPLSSVTARSQRPFCHSIPFPEHDTSAPLMTSSYLHRKNSSKNPWHHHHHLSPIMQSFTQHTITQATHTFCPYNQATPLSNPAIHPNEIIPIPSNRTYCHMSRLTTVTRNLLV